MTLENRKLWRINKIENWGLVLQLRDLKYRCKVLATNEQNEQQENAPDEQT